MKQTWLALKFIVGGLILLLISIVCDTFVFSYNLFTDIGKDELSLEVSGRITANGIKLFKEACDEAIENLDNEEGMINGAEFIKHLR